MRHTGRSYMRYPLPSRTSLSKQPRQQSVRSRTSLGSANDQLLGANATRLQHLLGIYNSIPPGNTWTGLGYTSNSLVNQAVFYTSSSTASRTLISPSAGPSAPPKFDPNCVYDVARVGLTFVGFVFIRPRRRFGRYVRPCALVPLALSRFGSS